jgi:surface polysaccharide O-acyltransferase-like enzyme
MLNCVNTRDQIIFTIWYITSNQPGMECWAWPLKRFKLNATGSFFTFTTYWKQQSQNCNDTWDYLIWTWTVYAVVIISLLAKVTKSQKTKHMLTL